MSIKTNKTLWINSFLSLNAFQAYAHPRTIYFTIVYTSIKKEVKEVYKKRVRQCLTPFSI